MMANMAREEVDGRMLIFKEKNFGSRVFLCKYAYIREQWQEKRVDKKRGMERASIPVFQRSHYISE
jgi:hypothetical protein